METQELSSRQNLLAITKLKSMAVGNEDIFFMTAYLDFKREVLMNSTVSCAASLLSIQKKR